MQRLCTLLSCLNGWLLWGLLVGGAKGGELTPAPRTVDLAWIEVVQRKPQTHFLLFLNDRIERIYCQENQSKLLEIHKHSFSVPCFKNVWWGSVIRHKKYPQYEGRRVSNARASLSHVPKLLTYLASSLVQKLWIWLQISERVDHSFLDNKQCGEDEPIAYGCQGAQNHEHDIHKVCILVQLVIWHHVPFPFVILGFLRQPILIRPKLLLLLSVLQYFSITLTLLKLHVQG